MTFLALATSGGLRGASGSMEDSFAPRTPSSARSAVRATVPKPAPVRSRNRRREGKLMVDLGQSLQRSLQAAAFAPSPLAGEGGSRAQRVNRVRGFFDDHPSPDLFAPRTTHPLP